TSLYGRFHYYGDRFRMQLGAGAIFLVAMTVGTLLSVLHADITVRIMTVALIATIVTGIVSGYKWHPGGATFAVFSSGPCNHAGGMVQHGPSAGGYYEQCAL